VPDFRLLIVGGGPEENRVRELAAQRPWVQLVGPKFGREKSVLLSLAEVWLNPGVVGLGVLDAFCAGLPVLTQRSAQQSPETEYITDDHNGCLLPDSRQAYAEAVIGLLQNDERLARLRAGAIESVQQYSVETMARNFTSGVLACLSRS
jgi:glycosyltransferase involved in cell wall biosynthesis